MDKLALADVFVYDGKRGAGHTAAKPHALCHASNEGGFSGSEVSVHGDNGSVGETFANFSPMLSVSVSLWLIYVCTDLTSFFKLFLNLNYTTSTSLRKGQ